MVNKIKKMMLSSLLVINGYAVAEVSHVSINQTLFEVGEAASFRVNIVAGDIDDVRFFIQDGENKERLSVKELNTFMLHVTGDNLISNERAELIVHEYRDGDWEKRQTFILFQKSSKPIIVAKKTAESPSLEGLSDNNTEPVSVEHDSMMIDGMEINSDISPNVANEAGGAVGAVPTTSASGLDAVSPMTNGADNLDMAALEEQTNVIDINKSALQQPALQDESLIELANDAVDIKETNVSELRLTDHSLTETQPVQSVANSPSAEVVALPTETIKHESTTQESIETAPVDDINMADVSTQVTSISSVDDHRDMALEVTTQERNGQDVVMSNQSLTSANSPSEALPESTVDAQNEPVCPIVVAKDETLWKIDLRYHAQWDIGLFGGALALFEANPRAFNKGSIHGLKAGARLTCPSNDILAKYQDESLAERFFLAM